MTAMSYSQVLFADYTLQTVLFIARLAHNGQTPLLKAMGLRDDQIDRFRALRLEDAWDLVRHIRGPLTAIHFDSAAIDAALLSCERRRAENDELDALINAGAPLPLMHAWYGLTSNDYTQRRKALGLAGDDGAGRPPKPSDDVQADIWHAWNRHRQLKVPARLLSVHADLTNTHPNIEMSIRIIMAVLRDSPDGAAIAGMLRGEPHER
jgi:hypothetical protein